MGGISPYSKVYIIASDIFVNFYRLTNLLNRDYQCIYTSQTSVKIQEAFLKKFFLFLSLILLYLWLISDMQALDFIAFSIFSSRIFRSLSSSIVRGLFFSLELKKFKSDFKGFFMSQTNNIKEHGNREK